MEEHIYTPTLRDILRSFPTIRKYEDWALMSFGKDIESGGLDTLLNVPVRSEGLFIGMPTSPEERYLPTLVNGREHAIYYRSLVVIKPGDVIYTRSFSPFSRVLYLYHKASVYLQIDLSRILPIIYHLSEQAVFALTEEEYDELLLLYDLAYKYILAEDERGQQMFHRLLGAFALKCAEVLAKYLPEGDKSKDERSRQDAWLLVEFLALLSEDCSRDKGLNYYAERLNLSYKHFSAVIKRASGRNASDWIDYHLLHEAKTLITYSKLSMQEVAYDLGFSSPSHFTKFFRQHVGLTPSEYQQKHREEMLG